MSIKIKENINLKKYNTFQIDVTTRYFVEISTTEELQELVFLPEFINSNKIILGGGSNVLFSENFDGLVIKNNLKGIFIIEESDKHVWLKAMSGENWHDLVLYSINHEYGGIENLSLIPGTVGAAPVQNIGAYGVELKEVFYSLEAIDFITGEIKKFNLDDCNFGYRDSIFKKEFKNKYFIISVILKLDKKPKFNISYKGLSDKLNKNNVQELTLKIISDAVCSIRREKLPDPKKIGNAGSFFQNPIVNKRQLDELIKRSKSIENNKYLNLVLQIMFKEFFRVYVKNNIPITLEDLFKEMILDLGEKLNPDSISKKIYMEYKDETEFSVFMGFTYFLETYFSSQKIGLDYLFNFELEKEITAKKNK